jgi:uncharacterized lipoprotein YajG
MRLNKLVFIAAMCVLIAGCQKEANLEAGEAWFVEEDGDDV